MPSYGTLKRDDNNVPVGWNKAVITAAAPTTTVVKAGPGMVHTITLNGPAATGTITVYDALTATGTPVAIITTPASPFPVTLTYDMKMDVGITVVTGTAAQNVTVTFI